jgi:hypothetical protein
MFAVLAAPGTVAGFQFEATFQLPLTGAAQPIAPDCATLIVLVALAVAVPEPSSNKVTVAVLAPGEL